MKLQTKSHDLEPINTSQSIYKYKCKACQQEWITSPKSVCPGVRVFSSRDSSVCPKHYKTLAELETKHLRPKKLDQPSAAFRPTHQGPWEFLYDETKAIPKRHSEVILGLLKAGLRLFAWLVNVVAAALIAVLLGLNPAPSSLTAVPMMNFVLQHSLFSLITACGIVLVTLIGLLLFLRLTTSNPQQVLARHLHPWSFVTVTSTASFLLCFSLLLIVFLRPSWCPTSLCPVPQRILITHPHSSHDENLEMYSITAQSTYYVIPGDPAHYTLDNLPMNIGALHTDGKNSTLLYHLILGLDSLQQGRFGITIQAVNLLIQQVAPIPHPLNVWNKTQSIQYENQNEYRALYLGQDAREIMPTNYLRFQSGLGYMHLKPRETDQMDIHVISNVEADIKFSVQISYLIDNETQPRLLQLSQPFEIMFADAWHLYRLQDGHLVTSS